MNFIVSIAEGFTGFFSAAGESFVGTMSGIVPLVLVALTVLNTAVALIGEDRFDSAARRLTKNFFARYTLLPYLANFMVGSPTSFTFGKYLHEKYKAGYYEVCNRTNMAPMMCLFPHVNPGELFVWLGVYNGVVQVAGERVGATLAVATFVLAFCTSSFIGLIVEKMSMFLAKRQGVDFDEIEKNKGEAAYADVM
ncbi:PTS glucitol/sorbitol transporter subunit IIC [Dysosmobacter sp. Sow4_B12]|uniref:PTS glucitol/sorbitol transporter subunit IIC n=1 Tax=Dysosmobacter sp. Sow4_B12 TaxID=3438777 RepID=UPI003F91BC45